MVERRISSLADWTISATRYVAVEVDEDVDVEGTSLSVAVVDIVVDEASLSVGVAPGSPVAYEDSVGNEVVVFRVVWLLICIPVEVVVAVAYAPYIYRPVVCVVVSVAVS